MFEPPFTLIHKWKAGWKTLLIKSFYSYAIRVYLKLDFMEHWMFTKAPKHDILPANQKAWKLALIHEIAHNLARECLRRALPNQTLYKQFGRQIVHNFTQVWGAKTLYYFVLSNSTIYCLFMWVFIIIHYFRQKDCFWIQIKLKAKTYQENCTNISKYLLVQKYELF